MEQGYHGKLNGKHGVDFEKKAVAGYRRMFWNEKITRIDLLPGQKLTLETCQWAVIVEGQSLDTTNQFHDACDNLKYEGMKAYNNILCDSEKGSVYITDLRAISWLMSMKDVCQGLYHI